MSQPQQPKAAPTNNQTTDQAIEKDVKYLVWNLVDHYQNDHPDPDQTEECRFAIETIEELSQLLANEVRKARVEEIENFEWNDPHMYVHTRLAQLKGEPTHE